MDLDNIGAVGAAGQPPAAFVRLVRDALAHLFDPAHLLQHPLLALLGVALPQRGDRAQDLRDFLLDAIEGIEPEHRSADERDRRAYLVLTHRYVDGFATDDIIERLHISPRQFQREHQKALAALAAFVWGACRHVSQQPAELVGTAASLEEEVESLGVEVVALPLAEIVAAAEAPCGALARRYGVSLAVLTPQAALRCICDPTLAKQALLSCLSAVMGSRPEAVQMGVAGSLRSPCVEVCIAPSVTASARGALEGELAACRTLLAAQGGGLQLVLQPEGAVNAVRLQFRPELGPHVLVVDDSEKMLQLYARSLAAGRYRVSTAASGEQAEAVLRQSAPDAIVLDVMMRGVDGWEMLQRLRSRPELAEVPVVVCSVLNEPDLAAALGAQAYLRKPIVFDDLLSALARVLNRSSAS